MEDSDPLGISQMRRIQRVGWTTRRSLAFRSTAGGEADLCRFVQTDRGRQTPSECENGGAENSSGLRLIPRTRQISTLLRDTFAGTLPRASKNGTSEQYGTADPGRAMIR